MLREKKKFQSLSEYAIMLGVVIGAVLLSQDMVKKAIVGKVKDGTKTLTSVRGDVAGIPFGGSSYEDAYKTKTDRTSSTRMESKVGKGMDVEYKTNATSRVEVYQEKLY